ncbi:MAG: glycosyltransferase [bacterium]|nr:glycosyltransferase [bacterium]
MKVLQAIAGGPHGGAENFFTRLVLALHRAGLDQKVLMKPNQHRRKVLEEGGGIPHEASFSKWTPWVTRQAYQEIIQNYQPDVVVTWMSRASHLCPRGDFVHVARLGGYYPLKYYKNCDHVVGNTQEIADYLSQGQWRENHVHYLPNFSDPATDKQCQSNLRTDFKTPEDVPLILGLGRLHKDKAFDILIPALSKISGAYLWIAGEGEERASLEKLARAEGVEDRVRFLGWQNHMSDFIQEADIIAFPSRIEPLGNVVLEAWSHKKPLVTAKSAGPGILVTHEKTGLLVEIDDIEGLSESLNRVIKDPVFAKGLAQKGYEEFQSKYTEEIVIKKYLQFFEMICSQKLKGN